MPKCRDNARRYSTTKKACFQRHGKSTFNDIGCQGSVTLHVGIRQQCTPALDDNVCRLTTTMYAGLQRQCMQAYNDNVCRLTTTMYAGLQ
ncbi:MAG: hypothetical protein LBS54_04755 [Dysgonamonadaceae bacterium]|nr:hypothetical protein [Dysgonamonadaceae bacterium]